MKKLNLEKIFVGLFVGILTLPTVFMLAFGYFLNWEQYKHFKVYDFFMGEYQEELKCFLKEDMPNIENISNQKLLNGVFLKDGDLVKINNNNEKFDDFSKTIPKFKSFFNRTDKPIYFLIIPSKNSFIEKKSEDFINGLKRDFDSTFQKNVSFVQTKSFFNKIKEISPYYRTSEKINGFGAYLIYCDLVKEIGEKSVDYANFSIYTVVDDYFGELYNKNFKDKIQPDVIEIYKHYYLNIKTSVKEIDFMGKTRSRDTIFDVSYINDSNRFNLIFGKPSLIKDVRTNLKNKDRVLIFCDENVNNLMQFLTLNFSQITLVNLNDFFYVKQNVFDKINLFKANGYDKIFFIYGYNNFTVYDQFNNLKYF